MKKKPHAIERKSNVTPRWKKDVSTDGKCSPPIYGKKTLLRENAMERNRDEEETVIERKCNREKMR